MKQYTETEKNTARMLIKFYNVQAGTSFRSGSETNPLGNMNRMLVILDKAKWDVAAVKAHIKVWVKDHLESATSATGLINCLDEFNLGCEPEAREENKAKVTDQAVGNAMGLLERAVVELISKTSAEKIEAEIMGQIEEKVATFISEEYGAIERKITTVVDGKRVPMKGIQHEKFEEILKFVSNRIPVYLTGPAGTGKNVLCKQIAEALELKFYFTNCVTQEYQLKGFTDAMGNYQPTQFYKAFVNGGLFMLDEMDASIPEVLDILNAALANRYFDFPAPIGYVEAHPDFRVIAAGNTFGTGADYQYVGRNQLDAASLDRFAYIKVGYSEAIENSVALGDLELAGFCREFRKAAEKTGQQIIVSYRAIERIATMMPIMKLDEVLESCLVKGAEKDDLNLIYNEIVLDTKYKRALKKLINRM